jgi:hypothetical protein
MFTENRWHKLWNFPGSLLIGAFGGATCGSLILSFGYFIGRGDAQTNTLGTFYVPGFILGALYGGLFGTFVVPIAYVLVLRRIGFSRPLVSAFVGTMVGGFLGAIVMPPLAMLMGTLGFSLGVAYAARKKL